MPILEEQSETAWEEWKAQLTQNTTAGQAYQQQQLAQQAPNQLQFGITSTAGMANLYPQATSGGIYSGIGGYAQNVAYPLSSPSYITPMIKQIPVIDESYPEKLHFMDSKGDIHSFSVDEVYTKLGLKW